ncbi:MAG: hypothetical protein WB565_10245 [Acidimicrobiales bacterium]
MARELTDSDLVEIETRLIAALQIITPPWETLLETGGYALGGESFIRGAHPEEDEEIYVTLSLRGELIRGPDERTDAVIDFLGNSAQDVGRLIAEVRRLNASD